MDPRGMGEPHLVPAPGLSRRRGASRGLDRGPLPWHGGGGRGRRDPRPRDQWWCRSQSRRLGLLAPRGQRTLGGQGFDRPSTAPRPAPLRPTRVLQGTRRGIGACPHPRVANRPGVRSYGVHSDQDLVPFRPGLDGGRHGQRHPGSSESPHPLDGDAFQPQGFFQVHSKGPVPSISRSTSLPFVHDQGGTGGRTSGPAQGSPIRRVPRGPRSSWTERATSEGPSQVPKTTLPWGTLPRGRWGGSTAPWEPKAAARASCNLTRRWSPSGGIQTRNRFIFFHLRGTMVP